MLEYTPDRHLTGGLRLPAHKFESTAHAIKRGLRPRRVILSTRQRAGAPLPPIVAVGDRVLRGQPVAGGTGAEGVVHASVSGTVAAIEERLVPLSTGTSRELSIVVDSDGQDRPFRTPDQSDWPSSRVERLARIRDAGIVGLGGALYPTAAKLGKGASLRMLIINGAECEPYISCDDMLMREAPQEIVAGAALLCDLVAAQQCVIAIERDKPQAIEAVSEAAAALGVERLKIAELPSIYPAGGERQLVEVLTGLEVPSDGYPTDVGCLCQNVGTAYAVERLARLGEPLTSRIVTVTGDGVREPANVEAPIGTPIADLIAFCGGYAPDVVRLVHGGSMMGYSLGSDEMPISKATNCIIAATSHEVRRDYTEWPCIRCGDCASACPVRLQPQELLIAARTRDFDGARRLGLRDCIECGCCDIACPSQIPLTSDFRRAKFELREHDRARALSEESAERFRLREQRLRALEGEERRQRETLKQDLASDDARAEAIAAAVERARRRRADAEELD